MNAWTDKDRDAWQDIDEVLDSEELAPVPPSLSIEVMRRIRSETPLPAVHFRLTWLDYALSFFAASMIGLVALLTLTLPRDMELYLQMKAFYWFERIRISPLMPVFLIGGAAFLIIAVVSAATVAWQWALNRNSQKI